MAYFGNKGRVEQQEHGDEEDWLVTYSDTVTLLMAFFAVLVAVSDFNVPMYERVKAGLSEHLGRSSEERPTGILQLQANQAVITSDTEAEVGSDKDGLVLDFPAIEFFDPGSAVLKPEADPILKEVAGLVTRIDFNSYDIEVQGHTDDVPITSDSFPSNWELSAIRATNVVRRLIRYGVQPHRMAAVGLADTLPKAPNSDAAGNPIPANQAKNRRIVIRVFPGARDERALDIDTAKAVRGGASDLTVGTTGITVPLRR